MRNHATHTDANHVKFALAGPANVVDDLDDILGHLRRGVATFRLIRLSDATIVDYEGRVLVAFVMCKGFCLALPCILHRTKAHNPLHHVSECKGAMGVRVPAEMEGCGRKLSKVRADIWVMQGCRDETWRNSNVEAVHAAETKRYRKSLLEIRRREMNYDMTNTTTLDARFGNGVDVTELMSRKYITHHHMSFAMTVKFVRYVNRSTSAFGNGNLPLLLWLKIPNDVVKLRMLEQLLGCHRSHSERCSDVLVY